MIREATIADGASIAAIWNPVIRDSLATFNSLEKTPEDVAALITARHSDGHAFFVADEGGIIGFATYAQFRGGVGYAHTMEHTVIMAQAARGRGVGRALMLAVEGHARAAGAHSMFAGVSAENAGAVRFHAALGYETVATLPEVGRKFDRWLDLVLMQKRL